MHQFNAWNGIIWSRGNMDFLWYHLWSQSNNSQLSIGISHWSRPGLVEAESWCLPGNEYVIGFLLHARVYFILCFPTVCVWKPAAGNELALQDNCWCAAGRLLGAVRCQRFVQCAIYWGCAGGVYLPSWQYITKLHDNSSFRFVQIMCWLVTIS